MRETHKTTLANGITVSILIDGEDLPEMKKILEKLVVPLIRLRDAEAKKKGIVVEKKAGCCGGGK